MEQKQCEKLSTEGDLEKFITKNAIQIGSYTLTFEFEANSEGLTAKATEKSTKDVFQLFLSLEEIDSMELQQDSSDPSEYVATMIKSALFESSEDFKAEYGFIKSKLIQEKPKMVKELKNNFSKGYEEDDGLAIIISLKHKWVSKSWIFYFSWVKRDNQEKLRDVVKEQHDLIHLLHTKIISSDNKLQQLTDEISKKEQKEKQVLEELNTIKIQFKDEMNKKEQKEKQTLEELNAIKTLFKDEMSKKEQKENQMLDELNKFKTQLQEQKEKEKKNEVAIWKSSTKSSNYLVWNTAVLYVDPMKSAVRINNCQVIFDVAGIYRIDIDYATTCGCSNGKYIYLYDLNGSTLLQHYRYTGGSGYEFCQISFIQQFTKGQGVSFYSPCSCGPIANVTQLIVTKMQS